MAKLLVLLAFVAAAGTAAAQDAAVAPAAVSPTGVKFWKNPLTAAKASNYSAFATAAVDSGLGKTLEDGALVATVFAPTDAALKAFADSTNPAVKAIAGDHAQLADVFKYHVVPGATLSTARVKDMVSKAPDGVVSYKTLQGERLNATLGADGGLLINGVAASGAADAQGGKTMLIGLGGVVVPPSMGVAAPAAANATADAAANATAATPAANATAKEAATAAVNALTAAMSGAGSAHATALLLVAAPVLALLL